MRVLPIPMTAAVLALAALPASAQTLTTRNSTLNYNYVYGAGGDSHVDGQNVADNTLLATDSEQTGTSGSTSGTLPGDPPSPYSAGVSCDLRHEYAITGPFSAFASIAAGGTAAVDTSASGAGTAQMLASNPGNSLTFYFDLTSPFYFTLSGLLTTDQPGFASGVALQHFNGIFWADIFTTILMPGSQGPFNTAGMLNPGQYRMVSLLALSGFANQSVDGSYNYVLSLFPRADMNCDGKVDGRDIQAFADAMLAPPTYTARYPLCNPLNGDFNNDAAVTAADVAPFTQCVVTGGCP